MRSRSTIPDDVRRDPVRLAEDLTAARAKRDHYLAVVEELVDKLPPFGWEAPAEFRERLLDACDLLELAETEIGTVETDLRRIVAPTD